MLLGVVFRRLLPYILGAILILGVGCWIFNTGYSSGVDDTVREYEVKIQKERERQQSANETALENSKKREAELHRLLSERNATIRLLMQEGFEDPNANRPSISVDGVQRLNRIR